MQECTAHIYQESFSFLGLYPQKQQLHDNAVINLSQQKHCSAFGNNLACYVFASSVVTDKCSKHISSKYYIVIFDLRWQPDHGSDTLVSSCHHKRQVWKTRRCFFEIK